MIQGQKGELELWLTFIQATFWPGIVIIAIGMFRVQIVALLGRISSFKFGSNEVAFQPPSEDAKKVAEPITKTNVVETLDGAFLNETGVRNAVQASNVLAEGDNIYRAVRIFQTRTQATWIIFSKQVVACILDDANGRASGRLLQWSIARRSDLPIRARLKQNGTGLVDIGSRQNWYYSTDLYLTPAALESELRGALAEGDKG